MPRLNPSLLAYLVRLAESNPDFDAIVPRITGRASPGRAHSKSRVPAARSNVTARSIGAVEMSSSCTSPARGACCCGSSMDGADASAAAPPGQAPGRIVSTPRKESLAPGTSLKTLKRMSKFHVTLYSDGGCKPNPGPGGWAAILKSGSRRKTLSGGCRRTTNNRMELRAVIEGFKALKQPGLTVQIVSDSRYVTESIARRWLDRWAAQRFRKAGGLRENADLWAELRELMAPHTVSTHWIRGHAGHRENERCKRLPIQAVFP